MTIKQQNPKKHNDPLVKLSVLDVIQKAKDVCTFQLDNSDGQLAPHKPGMFLKVCLNINETEVWRSFTISSSPLCPDKIDLTIKRNRLGQAGNYMFEHVTPGDQIYVKGPLGQFYFDQEQHTDPVILLCAGIGITPMMSIIRFLSDSKQYHPCYLFYGDRTDQSAIFDQEIRELNTEMPDFHYFLSLSEPASDWPGYRGRLNSEFVMSKIPQILQSHYFLCGPKRFNQEFECQLLEVGVSQSLIHREQFHKKRKPE